MNCAAPPHARSPLRETGKRYRKRKKKPVGRQVDTSGGPLVQYDARRCLLPLPVGDPQTLRETPNAATASQEPSEPNSDTLSLPRPGDERSTANILRAPEARDARVRRTTDRPRVPLSLSYPQRNLVKPQKTGKPQKTVEYPLAPNLLQILTPESPRYWTPPIILSHHS